MSPVLLAAVIAACGPSADSPVAPSFKPQGGGVVPFVETNATWDFTGILNLGAGCHDLGTEELITHTDPANGAINATSGAGTSLTSKGQELPVDDPERGLGLAFVTPCETSNQDEVGDGGPGFLYLDLNGVLPAGSTLREVAVGSVQDSEGWEIWYSTTGIGGAYALLSKGFGDGTNNPSDNVDIPVEPGIPTAGLVLRFQRNLDAPGEADTDNDYTVRNVTTGFTTDENLDGRMTGGGIKATGTNGEVVTFGLTLHCDILLSNNLEINWAGHKWHLTKPILTSACSDDPAIAPPPPVAPIDTFEGTAEGKLDGVSGSPITFKFQDAGEPGKDDMVAVTIRHPVTDAVVLQINLQKISVGNWQMHYDQPHGQKP